MDLNTLNSIALLAAEFGNSKMLKRLIAFGADTNACDDMGRTLLMISAQGGHHKCIKVLLDAECNVQTTDSAANNAVMHLMQSPDGLTTYGGMMSLFYLKLEGAEMNAENIHGEYPLSLAIVRDDTQQSVKALLDAGANPNFISNFDETPLQVATSYELENGLTYVKDLLEYKANPEFVPSSPLPSTVMTNSYELCLLLLDNNANLDGVNQSVGTLLLASAIFGRPQFTKLALTNNAKINISNYETIDESYKRAPENIEEEALMLVLASGEKYPYFESASEPAEIRNYNRDIGLANICRKFIRNQLMESNPTINLFELVRRTSLPPILQNYLVFDMSF